jgi:hypothetical protein
MEFPRIQKKKEMKQIINAGDVKKKSVCVVK